MSDEASFDATRWHWVVDEVLPRIGMFVGRPTYGLARAWVEGLSCADPERDNFIRSFQAWLSQMPEHHVVNNHAWWSLVLREVTSTPESELSPKDDAAAIAHLRSRLQEFLMLAPGAVTPSNGLEPDPVQQGEWAYLLTQVVHQGSPDATTVRLPNGQEATVQPRHLARQMVRFGKRPQEDHERLLAGDIYEDCAYHPVLATHVNYDEDEIEGISLIDGSQPRSCSLTHCGVRRVTVAEVLRLRGGAGSIRAD